MHEETLKIIIAGAQHTGEKILTYKDQSLIDITKEIPYLRDGYDVVVNGKQILDKDWLAFRLSPEDEITFVPNFGAGGIALAIMGLAAAPAAAFTLTYIAYAALTLAISIGISIGVGYLIKSLTPSPKKAVDTPSQAYSWEPRTTQQQGLVKPKIFGKFKSLGNIIAGHVHILGTDNTKLVMNALVSHGTGPIKSISDIRINNQPDTNFPGVTIDTRRGLLEQTPITAFDELRIQFRPNIDVTHDGGALTWEVPDDDYDDIEVILRCNIYYFHKSGSPGATAVTTKIECREQGEAWEIIFNAAISNTGTRTFWKSFLFSDYGFTVERGKKYDIRITKVSADIDHSRVKHEIALEFVSQISTDALEYPGLVLVGITGVLTDAFTGLQSTSCIIEGQIVYQWDDVGLEWILDWTVNPGWVASSVLTQPVISGDGSGTPYAIEKLEGLPNDRINWDDVKELVAHSDTECPDGKGGTEPLITFNGSFDTAISTWNAALDVCKIARSVPIWKGNVVDFVIDKPTGRTDVIAAGNIIDGSFDETFLPKKNRVSAIDVAYNDINTDYERVFLRTFSTVLPESSNVLTLDFRGIVKKTEAWRLAKFHQAYNDLIHRTIRCKADIDALTYQLGDVLGVQWDATNWNKLKDIGQRGSGRILAFTYDAGGDIITLDYDIEAAFEAGSTYEILIRLRDDTQVLKTIASAVGNVVTIIGHYAEEPSLDDLWIVGLQNFVVKDFRLINRSQSKSISYELTLLEYDEDIWANDLLAPPVTGLYTTPAQSASGSVLQPPSQEDLQTLAPQIALGGDGGTAGGGVDGISTSNIRFYNVLADVDSYILNDNTAVSFQGADFSEAQKFEASASYDIESVKLKLYRSGTPGDLTVSVRAIDGGGHPVAPNLAVGTTDGDTLPDGPDDLLHQESPDGGVGLALYCSACQTFTPEESHTLSRVDLKLKRPAAPAAGTGTISLHNVDGSHQPTGAALIEIGSFDIYDLTTSYVWYEFDSLDYDLVADIEYAIVIVMTGVAVCDAGDLTDSVIYWDQKVGGYARGVGWYKLCALNGSWACQVVWSGTNDYCFKEYRAGSGMEWREITFVAPTSLTSGVEYAIVCESETETGAIHWRADENVTPGYPNGNREREAYTFWQTKLDFDYMFETYGAGTNVGWEAEDPTDTMLLNFEGEVYIIVPGETVEEYIYWDSDTSETVLQTTSDQSIIEAGNFSVLCYNDDGVPYVY